MGVKSVIAKNVLKGAVKTGKKLVVPAVATAAGGKLVKVAKDKANEKANQVEKNRELFAENLKNLSDEDLKIYIPDVYQRSIYDIDYNLLWEKGVRLLSFDIDDTIADSAINKVAATVNMIHMPEEAEELFGWLKEKGFKVILITNAWAKVARPVCNQLKADDYIERAGKPETRSFENAMAKFDIKPEQMAHIGNSMKQDVVGGNRAGVFTCLIRRNGVTLKVGKGVKAAVGMPTEGHLIREELLRRDLWRKHQKFEKGDQYYQLGEEPLYRR